MRNTQWKKALFSWPLGRGVASQGGALTLLGGERQQVEELLHLLDVDKRRSRESNSVGAQVEANRESARQGIQRKSNVCGRKKGK